MKYRFDINIDTYQVIYFYYPISLVFLFQKNLIERRGNSLRSVVNTILEIEVPYFYRCFREKIIGEKGSIDL